MVNRLSFVIVLQQRQFFHLVLYFVFDYLVSDSSLFIPIKVFFILVIFILFQPATGENSIKFAPKVEFSVAS